MCGAFARSLTALCRDFRALGRVPRYLWIIFVLKVLESFAYFSMSLNMTLYFSDEFGMSDQRAGWLFGTWGVLISVYGLLGGCLIDALGVRCSLILGSLISAAGRLLFALTTTHAGLLLATLCLMPAGMALGIPVLTIAVKRYSCSANRTFLFGLFYSVMNVAALVAGPVTDSLNSAFASGLVVGGRSLSSLRLVFCLGSLTTLSMVVIAACGIKEVAVDDRTGELRAFTPGAGGSGDAGGSSSGTTPSYRRACCGSRDAVGNGPARTISARARQSAARVRALCQERRFRALLLFSLLLVGVRFIFRHLEATLPKWMKREIGPDALYGTVYAINPFCIILLVPVVASLTKHRNVVSCVISGAFVSAASPFFLCLGAHYWNAVLFVLVLSVGEAVYSPKVYEYGMMLAPDGDEGVYTALSSVPMFVAKLGAGGMSGTLLAKFCARAENGQPPPHRDCELMWFIIGVTSMTSPVLMLLLRRWIDVPRQSNHSTGAPDADADTSAQSLIGVSLEMTTREPQRSTGRGVHESKKGKRSTAKALFQRDYKRHDGDPDAQRRLRSGSRNGVVAAATVVPVPASATDSDSERAVL